MTPRERSGDFAQVAYQVVKEATADDDAADDAREAEERSDADRAPSKKVAEG